MKSPNKGYRRCGGKVEGWIYIFRVLLIAFCARKRGVGGFQTVLSPPVKRYGGF